MVSTPTTRAAKRDYWTSDSAYKWCARLDQSAVWFLFTAVFILGSISPK
jgi:hypothetical protein